MKQAFFIDVHKGATALVVLACIVVFHKMNSVTAWMYFALHGTYGVLWVLKSRVFGDKHWESHASVGRAALIWAGLSLYWVSPVLICARATEDPPALVAVSTVLFGLGVFLHFASDMQKHMHLKLAPHTLLHTGLWARTRNPNYLGELLIYLSFALLTWHPYPFVVLALFFAVEWWPNMRKKDASLARYPGFAAYAAKSGRLFPKLGWADERVGYALFCTVARRSRPSAVRSK